MSFSLSKQQGVALMIVILVFALVSILAVGMYNRQSIFVQTSATLFAQSQAYEYALASEIYGRRLLKADWDEDKEDNEFVDDLEQVQNAIVVPVEEAILEAQFNDMHGKLNVNDLVALDGSPNPLMVTRMKRLLNRLALETVKVDAMIDWLDENQEPNDFEGAEDGEYLVADPPYRNAGQRFQHVSELYLLAGVDRSEIDKLLAHVSVLPQGRAAINLNTATPEVLQSLVEGLADQVADDLVAAREEKVWKTVDEFKQEPFLKGMNFDDAYLAVHSEFFEIATRISLSDRVVSLVSLLHREPDDGTIKVLSRDQGQKYLITKEKVAL